MKRTEELGSESISKLLVKFSIPAIIGMLVNALYNVVDRIFVGNSEGSLAIAGITVAFPLVLVILACALLIGVGSASLISIRLGEQREEEARVILGNALSLLLIISFLITTGSILFLEPLLRLFGASDAVLPYAKEYTRIIMLGNFFFLVGIGMNNIIRAEGSPKIAMKTMMIGAFTNIVLDYLFIFVFGWGIRGAAVATVIAKGCAAAWVMYHFTFGSSSLKIESKYLRLKFNIVKLIIMVGSAQFALQLATSLFNFIMNKSLTIYGGDTALSGMGVMMSIMTLILMPIYGITQGMQPIIGFNYGAKKYDRVKDALKKGIIAATSLCMVGFFLIRVFPVQLVSLFNNEPELIAFGVRSLKVYMALLPLIGFQTVGSNYFQAIGKPKQAAFLSLTRQVIFLIPTLLILPRFLGLEGVLLSGPVADLSAFLITGFWVLNEAKKLDIDNLTEEEKMVVNPSDIS
ncbi:MATE family efflux transporter [Serpentinicella alkaliphila]|uniref:Multidrug export protein MepA n=1 Tax=Serpentinicella alkaliphila TaxID=1734049 RepID=A0A4R2T8R8_9FIRM|nr:MATE family efflux transporter [Serpentinicella alkaliphila]QUH26556.1 MATE family efflux transporter [Serpentinicella alkaliphila]TCP99040.1 putative MATE family efflux protein [Serpentinicella alkaliphila]